MVHQPRDLFRILHLDQLIAEEWRVPAVVDRSEKELVAPVIVSGVDQINETQQPAEVERVGCFPFGIATVDLAPLLAH